MVNVDGQLGVVIDCSQLRADNIHAVQWYDSHGEIEFTTEYLSKEKRWHKEPNEHITDFSRFRSYVDQWIVAKSKYDQEQAEIKAKMEQERFNAEATAKKANEEMKKMMTEAASKPVT
jgi:hypothetical protein